MLSLEKPGMLATKNLLTSPYSLIETFGWVKRFFLGLSDKNEGHIKYLPKTFRMNQISPKYTIALIGDIMDLKSNKLVIHKSVKNFIKGSDFLVGNFEGILGSKISRFQNKQHNPQILDALATLFPPNKTFLSVANNHSGDLGEKSLFHTIKGLKKHGFNVFGTVKNPWADLTEELRVVGATQWSNRPCSYITKLEDATNFLKKGSFNLLFPHWGYERELYPRLKIIRRGEHLLDGFNSLIGHHSHCPQPVSLFKVNKMKKLVAFSLGNFCYSLDNKKHEGYNYGIAVKMEIGKSIKGKWSVGKVSWTFLKSTTKSKSSIVKTGTTFRPSTLKLLRLKENGYFLKNLNIM
jgi:hypothetical protein